MTEAELIEQAAQAKARTRAKGVWHYHKDLHSLEPVGQALGFEWESHFGKRPCEVCNAFAAGERVICYGYAKVYPVGPARLTRNGEPLELSACLDCLAAWQEV